MEREFVFPPDCDDEIPLEPVAVDPPEPRPNRPFGFDSDPTSGPWFTLSMAVFVALTLLTLGTLRAGAHGGPALAWALILGFLVLSVGYLAVGGLWFGSLRRPRR